MAFGLIRLLKFIIIICFTLITASSEVVANSVGWPEDIISVKNPDSEVIIVEKESQKLFYLKKNGDNRFHNILELKCSTGKNEGDKNIEGDSKTPEGVYFVTGHYPDKYLSPVYGSRAFTLNYPNYMDKIEGKNGHNIWIHGTDKEPLEERTTNGCVALANNDIDKLKDKINIGTTPVLIVKKLRLTEKEKIDEKVGKRIEVFFDKWMRSIKNGSYHDYLNFYSNDYLPDITWWPEWIEARKRLIRKDFFVNPKGLSIFREDKNIYTIWFDFEIYVGKKSSVVGKRKLFVKDFGDRFEIFGDFYSNGSNGILETVQKLTKGIYVEEDIKDLIKKWSESWSGKDLKGYADCYAKDFYSDGMNRDKWIANKNRLNKKYKYINIQVKNLAVDDKGNTARASFFQIYESSGFRASGIKTLILKQENGKWKIFKEIWKKAD